MKKLNNHINNKEALSFLRQELSHYRWYSNLLPVLAAVIQVALSVILMILPKIVLDAVQTEVKSCDFIRNIMLVGAAFTALTLANMFFHNEITKISQTFF